MPCPGCDEELRFAIRGESRPCELPKSSVSTVSSRVDFSDRPPETRIDFGDGSPVAAWVQCRIGLRIDSWPCRQRWKCASKSVAHHEPWRKTSGSDRSIRVRSSSLPQTPSHTAARSCCRFSMAASPCRVIPTRVDVFVELANRQRSAASCGEPLASIDLATVLASCKYRVLL